MSAFEALRILRKESVNSPEIDIKALAELLKKNQATAQFLDMEAGLELHNITEKDAPYNDVSFYRICIFSVITTYFPTWTKLITLGRTRFIKKINAEEFRDVRALFRQAKLLEVPPLQSDIQWWDDLSGKVRLESDRIKMKRARMAEELSLNYERERLRKEGYSLEPVWMALEDNTVGYDILSYEVGEYGKINKLIEVKSTISLPLRFFITRNEWEKALQVGEAYIFHIWNLSTSKPVLHLKTVSEISFHIPKDNLDGKWSAVEIFI